MTGKEAKELFIKHSETKFNEMGYFLKKTRNIEIIYLKNLKNGFEIIGISSLDYKPLRIFQFGTGKRINEIENIALDLNKILPLSINSFINNEINNMKSETLNYNDTLQNRRQLDLKLSQIIKLGNEEEIIKSSEIIINFMEEKVIPTYNSFNDIKNIDNTINGEGDNFWETDNDNSKPFTLAHLFYARRLIIGRLVKNDGDFDRFIDKVYVNIGKRRIELNEPPLDRNDLNNITNIIIKYLKENVKPIY